MEAVYNFLTFILIAIAAIVVIAVIVVMLNKMPPEVSFKVARTETNNFVADDAEYELSCHALRLEYLSDCDYYARVRVNSRAGFVALSNDGQSLRYLTWGREGNGTYDVIERTYSARQIVGVTIDQPTESRVITHKEKTPVAVNVRRSAGGRALIGGIVAGPAGAIIGGASGLNGKTKIKMVNTERQETVYSKGRPKLVVQLDDVHIPRRVMTFPTPEETDEWSGRIRAIMSRGRS